MAASPAPAAGPARSLLLCVITNDRGEVSLACASNLLRFQTQLMTTAEAVRTDMQFVRRFDDALNALRAHDSAEGAVVIDGTLGFDAQFPLRCLRSGRPLVAGCYPLPVIDWDRVAGQPEGEEPRQWGNQYSAVLAGPVDADGYAPASEARLGLAWVAKRVVDALVTREPGVVSEDGTACFAARGVYDGKLRDEHQRFLDLCGRCGFRAAVDVTMPAVSSGPVEFGGCVGARPTLR
jgi:hypothetical protein